MLLNSSPQEEGLSFCQRQQQTWEMAKDGSNQQHVFGKLLSTWYKANLQHENLQSPWAMILFFGCHEASWDVCLFRKAVFTHHNTVPSPSLVSDLHKGQTWYSVLHS